MDPRLFTERSVWTMVHGMVLGGGALLALVAALFALVAMRTADGTAAAEAAARHQGRYLAWAMVVAAATLWLATIVGTYVSFPPYRATPPEGLADLSAYPRALLRANPSTAWLHSFAMESKEHVPWIAAMLATAVAFVGVRYRATLLRAAPLRRLAATLLAICVVLVAYVALLGVLVNKVAPLD